MGVLNGYEGTEEVAERLYKNTTCLSPMVRAVCIPMIQSIRRVMQAVGIESLTSELGYDRAHFLYGYYHSNMVPIRSIRKKSSIKKMITCNRHVNGKKKRRSKEVIYGLWNRRERGLGEERYNRREKVYNRLIGTVTLEKLQTVDYYAKHAYDLVLQTCAKERKHIVCQLGTADAVLALKAAEIITPDVEGIDINMGCPKHFSIQGGMGAALLKTPLIASDILKILRRNLNVPVSCKIRLLDTPMETIDYAKSMENAGAYAIGVHARYVHETAKSGKMPAHWDQLPLLTSSITVPILGNGDIYSYSDIHQMKTSTKCSSVLIGRGALANASIFSPNGFISTYRLIKEYLRLCIDYDNNFQNSKYVISRMAPSQYDNGVSYYPHGLHVIRAQLPKTPLEEQRTINDLASIKSNEN